MIARYAVEHEIEFEYSAPVSGSVMTLHLCPLQDRRQVVRSFALETDPAGTVFEFEGPFHNRGHFLDRPAPHRRLSIRARSAVEVASAREARRPGEDARGWAALAKAAREPSLSLMLQPSRFARPSPKLEAFARAYSLEPGHDPLSTAQALGHRLHELFTYLPGTTVVDSPIERILDTRQGVCQDYAHVMTAILRGWGIPTRYVSGYLGPDEAAAGRGVATGESHAWVQCWLPGSGWTGFDPTNDSQSDARHVRVAVGRDYADVPPTRGVFQGAADSTLRTRVRVERLDLHPIT